MYRCLECDAEFEEPVKFEESRGEFWGVPCSETLWGCPYCHGDYLSEEDYKRDILGKDDEKESEENEDGK